jgi:T-complex protein 1 subunit beta
MDTDKIKIYGARVRVDSMAKVADIEAAEKEKMREKCEKIVGHGISCFVNRQLIYNYPEQVRGGRAWEEPAAGRGLLLGRRGAGCD